MCLLKGKSKKEKDRNTRTIWLFWLVFFILIIWVFWMNIFPTRYYYFHQNVSNGLRILDKKISDQYYFFIPLERDGIISQLKIEAQFSGNNTDLKNKNDKDSFLGQIQLAKNYEATLYPFGEDITSAEQLKEIIFWQNETTIPNGALISDDRAVYVISEGKKRPFISPEVFESLGYQWEKIQTGITIPEVPMGEVLNLQSVHPEGTIFRDDKGNFFIFFKNQKRRVAGELLKQVWSDFFWIDLSDDQPKYFASCNYSFIQKDRIDISCRFNLAKEKTKANVFIIKADGLDNWKVNDFQAKTTSSVFFDPKKSLKLFWEKVKNSLVIKYGFLKNKFSYVKKIERFF